MFSKIHSNEVINFIKENAVIVTLASGETYYQIPQWFTINEDNSLDQYEINQLPLEVKEYKEENQ